MLKPNVFNLDNSPVVIVVYHKVFICMIESKVFSQKFDVDDEMIVDMISNLIFLFALSGVYFFKSKKGFNMI